MEDLLREAACLGNLDAVQTLLQKGACINSQHSINGWTALHWACKRSHVAIVQHLLQNGADVNLLSCKSESVADVTSNSQVLELLQRRSSKLTAVQTTSVEQLPIVPNYIKHPPFPYYDVQKSLEKLPKVHTVKSTNTSTSHCFQTQTFSPHSVSSSDSLSTEMKTLSLKPEHNSVSSSNGIGDKLSSVLVKVRVCGSGECDFVEVEVKPVTYLALLAACCEELELASSDVAKIRKLPNVLIRKDKDIQRMRDGQELEVVLKSDQDK